MEVNCNLSECKYLPYFSVEILHEMLTFFVFVFVFCSFFFFFFWMSFVVKFHRH